MTVKLVFALAILVFGASALAQDLEGRDLITDPAISGRCKSLLGERKNKIQTQQRLHALLRRNEKLLKKVPQEKDSIKSRLEFTHTKIINNIRLSKMNLQKMEEDIVRRGCPGISL